MSPRRFGLPTAVALVVANMVGVGVFTTSGFSLQSLGTPAAVLWVWAVAGSLAVLGALCYGALARRLTASGGEYLFLSRTLHPVLGFVAGWLSLWAGFTGPLAAAAAGLDAYLAPALGLRGQGPWLGTAALLTAGAVQCSVGLGARVQNGIVVAKMAMLLVLLAVGIACLPGGERTPVAATVTLGGFATAVMWVSFSYSGWNAAVYVAGEVRDPQRTVPRALLWGAVFVTVFYLLVNGVIVHAAPVAELAGQKDVAAVAARALGGTGFETAVRAVVVVALFTSMTSMAMIGPRVYAQMADDGVFPRWFRLGVAAPRAAIVLQIFLAVVVLWISRLEQLLAFLGFTLSLSTALTVVGLVRLRLMEGAQAVPVPGWPWVPLLFVGGTLLLAGLMAFETAGEPLVALVVVGSGVVLGCATRRGKR